MSSVRMNTVREGVRLLAKVMKEADAQNTDDGKVSRRDVSNMLDVHGDGGAMDTAVQKLHAYARHLTGEQSPAVQDVNKALSKAMRSISRADANKNRSLSDTEQRDLATTWKAIVEFSKEYKGVSIDQIMGAHE